jgi:SNF2 family DNA or RNA helicase
MLCLFTMPWCSWETEEDLLAGGFKAELEAYAKRRMPIIQAASQQQQQQQQQQQHRQHTSEHLQQQQQQQQQNEQPPSTAVMGSTTGDEDAVRGSSGGGGGGGGGVDGGEGGGSGGATCVGLGSRRFTSTPPWIAKSGNLHPYQLEGLNWLFHKWSCKENVILADEVCE